MTFCLLVPENVVSQLRKWDYCTWVLVVYVYVCIVNADSVTLLTFTCFLSVTHSHLSFPQRFSWPSLSHSVTYAHTCSVTYTRLDSHIILLLSVFVSYTHTHTHTMSRSVTRPRWGQHQSKIKPPSQVSAKLLLESPGSVRMYQPSKICWPLPAYSATCFSGNFVVSSKGQGLDKCYGQRLFSLLLPSMLPAFNSDRQSEDCLLLLEWEALHVVDVIKNSFDYILM